MIPKTSKFPRVAKFFKLFRTDAFLVCNISFRFSDGVSLIFLKQSIGNHIVRRVQGDNFTLLVQMPVKLLKYDLSRFGIVC